MTNNNIIRTSWHTLKNSFRRIITKIELSTRVFKRNAASSNSEKTPVLELLDLYSTKKPVVSGNTVRLLIEKSQIRLIRPKEYKTTKLMNLNQSVNKGHVSLTKTEHSYKTIYKDKTRNIGSKKYKRKYDQKYSRDEIIMNELTLVPRTSEYQNGYLDIAESNPYINYI